MTFCITATTHQHRTRPVVHSDLTSFYLYRCPFPFSVFSSFRPQFRQKWITGESLVDPCTVVVASWLLPEIKEALLPVLFIGKLCCAVYWRKAFESNAAKRVRRKRGRKRETGRPKTICGQQYPLPWFAWSWIGVRGSGVAVPKHSRLYEEKCLITSEGTFMLKMEKLKTPNLISRLYVFNQPAIGWYLDTK